MIKQLSERDHIRQRPNMYIGSVDISEKQEYILQDNKISFDKVTYCDGLVKIVNEIIDNCVDVAIKTNFKSSNLITVKMDDTKVIVEDNGTGIPIIKNEDGHYLPELCWNHARAGSNFDDDKNRTQIGMNGVGSYTTACFSKKFIGETDDGKKSYKIIIKDGASSFTESVDESKQQGTKVTFYPDLEMFGVDSLDETHHNIIKQRLINLSMSFPEITFKFNAKKVNTSTFRQYLKLFNETFEMFETDNYRFAILPNDNDDFQQFSYVNGLKIPDGGTHIDIISDTIVGGIREKISKKYKTIKPGDIKNKLMIVAFLKNLPNPKFNSQAKEKITNSIREINTYFGDIPYDKMVAKILKTEAIMDPITEVYRIKEEFKRRQEMKGLAKTNKKVKSKKYLPSIGKKKYLLMVEGESALGGLSPVLGRKECGYYVLKGVPLNAYDKPQKDFTNNEELSDLFKIIQNEDYEYLIIATDQDLDGFKIRGLLAGFFHRYTPELKGRIGVLSTPVIGIKNGTKLVKWSYSLSDEMKVKSGETSKYYKGLGSWKEKDLKEVIAKDGLEEMITLFEWDDDNIINDWLAGNMTDKRKEYLMANEFSIAKL